MTPEDWNYDTILPTECIEEVKENRNIDWNFVINELTLATLIPIGFYIIKFLF